MAEEAELTLCFAVKADAIASQGAAPDWAKQMTAFHTGFDAECTRMQESAADLGTTPRLNR